MISRAIVTVLFLAVSAFGQDFTCTHCSMKDIEAQFGKPYSQPAHFFTKPYVAAETLHALAITTDILITLKRENPRRGCLEGSNGFPEFVHAPELVGEATAEMGFGFFVRWIMTREKPPKAFRFISFMTPMWGSGIHTLGAVRWYTQCR